MKRALASAVVCIYFAVSVFGLAAGANLFKDSDFEEAAKGGVDWSADFYKKDAGSKADFVDGGVTGKCLYIESPQENHCYVLQDVTVESGKIYKVSGMVRTDGITGNKGANIGIMSMLVSTNDVKENTGGKFVPVEMYIKPQMTTLTMMLALGGYGALASGRAWYDDVSFTEITADQVPAEKSVVDVKPPENKSNQSSKSGESSGQNIDNGWYGLMMFTAGLIVGSAIFIYLPVIKSKIEEIKQREAERQEEEEMAHEEEEADEDEDNKDNEDNS